MVVNLSHLPDDLGSLESGLGGSLGAGVKGEYLDRSGGGGRNKGLVTITGVWGLEGGEQGGVSKASLLGDKALLTAGDKGGWLGGGLVGLMPGRLGVLDINFRVGGWLITQLALDQQLSRSFQRHKVSYKSGSWKIAAQGTLTSSWLVEQIPGSDSVS